MGKDLTISIAAYNVENYLSDALDSIVRAKCIDDVEVLIVDDGSVDSTGQIALEYQKRYPNSVKYVRKSNGGHGSTINKGVELASGKYFKVLDGDDWLDTQALDEFIDATKRSDADLIITAGKKVYVDGGEESDDPNAALSIGLHRFADNNTPSPTLFLASTAIRTVKLKQIFEPILEHCYYVDLQFVMQCLLAADTYEYFPLSLYCYRVGQQGQSTDKSQMLKNVSMQERVSMRIAEIYSRYIKNHSIPDSKNMTINRLIIQSIGATVRTHLLHRTNKEVRNGLLSYWSSLEEKYPTIAAIAEQDLSVKLSVACNGLLLPIMSATYRAYLKSGRG